MEDLLRFYVPVAVTFGVALLIGYLLGQFAAYEEARRVGLSDPWPKVPGGAESPVHDDGVAHSSPFE